VIFAAPFGAAIKGRTGLQKGRQPPDGAQPPPALADEDDDAKLDIFLPVSTDPHSGHSAFAWSPILRNSVKTFPHVVQENSYRGMVYTLFFYFIQKESCMVLIPRSKRPCAVTEIQ
jgi:hypothetical protein